MNSKVAVIGAGALGLSATKNFIEDGFEVTTYEFRDYVGGLWKDSDDSSLSVHSTTIFNTSKFCAAFSDFPLAETDDDYPTATQLHEWLQRYARHFGLLPRIKFGTRVINIRRKSAEWALETRESTGKIITEKFDKVCIATGTFVSPRFPKLAGLEQFAGKVIHAIDFHGSKDFKDQNVLLLGMHATAQDVTNSLSETAKHVYMAHRGGLMLLPRYTEDGATFDQASNLGLFFLMAWMYRNFPTLWDWMINKVLIGISAKAFPNIPDEWGIRPAPHAAVATPLMADTLWSHLQSRFAEPVAPVSRVVGPRSIQLQNGRVLEDIDSIIYCTGYNHALPEGLILKTSSSETIHPYPGDSDGEPPNLYRNMFPLHSDRAIRESLAFLGHNGIVYPGFIQWEVNAMAISQIWQGKSALPPYNEMLNWRKRHLAERQANINRYDPLEHSTYYSGLVNLGDHIKWVDDVAGTGLYQNLGNAWFNWRSWKLWWQDKELYNLCMKGIFAPAIWRLFETGKRKAVSREECRAIIFRQNELAAEQKKLRLESKKTL